MEPPRYQSQGDDSLSVPGEFWFFSLKLAEAEEKDTLGLSHQADQEGLQHSFITLIQARLWEQDN